jgi:hypothetical protein
MGIHPMGIPPMGITPMGIPPMGIPPMGIPPMGIPPMGIPPMGIPLMGTGIFAVNSQSAISGSPLTPVYSHLATSLPSKKNTFVGRKAPKQASTAFRVLAPEEVLLKSVRRAFQEKFEIWRADTLKINPPKVTKEVVVQPNPAPRGSQRNVQRGGNRQRGNQRQARQPQPQPVTQIVEVVDVSQFSRVLDDRPVYFQKKKANQKRRRQ